MNDDAQQQWAKRAILAVHWSFPDVEKVEARSKCQQWLPHALVCADFIEKWKSSFNEAARLMNQAGYYLSDRAQYAEAELLLKRALEIHEEVQGERHPDTARSLNNLGMLYKVQRKYAEAEPLLKRALIIYEQILGPKHPDTITIRNNYDGLLQRMKAG